MGQPLFTIGCLACDKERLTGSISRWGQAQNHAPNVRYVDPGASQERGASYDVPSTGEEMVGRRTNFSPVPGTFIPKLGRTLLTHLT